MTACIVAKPGAALDEASVIAFCKAHMAHFKVPKKVILVEGLPKNPSGKILKRELRLKYEHTMKE